VLRAAGEAETTQVNIQDWLELDEGNPGFPLVTEEEIVPMLLYYLFHQHYIYHYIFILCSISYCLLGLFFASFIPMTSPPN
jgi:hypothetical protein